MNLSLFLGRRLSFNPGTDRGKKRKAPPGVAVGVAGIALALLVMMVSIAVVTGFKHEIREKVTGFESQLTIYAQDGYTDSSERGAICLTPQLREVITSVTGDRAHISGSIRQPGILKSDSAFAGVVIRGVSPDYDWNFIRQSIIAGELPDYASGADSLTTTVIISGEQARVLGIKVGDRVFAHFFRDNRIASRRLTVKAIYDTHFSDYDVLYAYTPASLLQQLTGADSTIMASIEVNGLGDIDVDEVADNLRSTLMQYSIDTTPGRIYSVESVTQSGAMYFNWLQLLDTNVVVILILMTLVSGFTLISSLFILILDRVTTIGVLKALGATDSLIRRTFIVMAERLVLRGLLIGNAVGLALLYAQRIWHVIPLNPEAYYLSYVPVEINWWHILLLNVGVAVVSCAMLIFPSHMVSTLSPSRSMRYE